MSSTKKATLCEHGKRKSRCRECGGSAFCSHGREKYRCKDCGTGLCIHGKRTDICKDCSTQTFCEHNRQRHTCVECKGSSICDHGIRKVLCGECGGASLCIHKKQKQICLECEGSSICPHKRQRGHCRECNGNFCKHNRKTHLCKDCGGSSICEHGVQKSKCKPCHGSFICPHDKQRNRCALCDGANCCPLCKDHPDARCGSKQYDGHCATCFKRAFPSDPRSLVIYQHTKEIRVRNAINSRFEGFVHDHPLYTGNCDCTHRRRIDHRKLIGNTMLAIETDERAHRSYDKEDEEIRYDDLYMVYSGKWIYIRFNPDTTSDDKTDLDDRIAVLLNTMEQHIERIEKEENTSLVEIIYLYY
jgi:hypothetical protein